MPPSMSFSPAAFRSPRQNGNNGGARPVVRQSKIYRERESGNAMKGIFGQDHLAWKTDEQQGVFAGQGVYDAVQHDVTSPPSQSYATGAATMNNVPTQMEYPNPGSSATCDACYQVVNRYYHCLDCAEETGLLDLCSECCAAIYLKQGSPRALARAQMPAHPTHLYATHRMAHVVPPGT